MRIRSPNYPSLSLPDAIDLIDKIYKNSRTNSIDRDAAVKDMGYSGITGRSGKLLATLIQYALLEKSGKGGVRVSKRAVDILHPDPNDQSAKRQALYEAAFSVSLFSDLRDRFSDGVPSEHALRSYLMREGFNEAAVSPTINSYLETYRFLQQENALNGIKIADDEPKEINEFINEDNASAPILPSVRPMVSTNIPSRQEFFGEKNTENERIVFTEETSPTQSLKLIARGEIDLSLLEALEDYVKRQKKRLNS